MSTNVGFYVKWFCWINGFVEISFTSFNSSWFPITMESTCFDVQHLKLCAHLCWFGWWASILCYSTWGWITFTVWGYHFLFIRGSIWEFKSHVIRFLPLLLSFGEKSGWIRYLHSCCILVAWIIWCSDIFILCKCMWQICNVLQIYDWTLCSIFFKYVNMRTECLWHFYFIYRHSLWY
jgi:hypothetical protein